MLVILNRKHKFLYSHNQLPVGPQHALLVQLGQCLADHLHIGRQSTDLKLVEPLIANVVGDVLDDEHDH